MCHAVIAAMGTTGSYDVHDEYGEGPVKGRPFAVEVQVSWRSVQFLEGTRERHLAHRESDAKSR